MNFPDSPARRLDSGQGRIQIVTRLLAFVRAPTLDEDLAAGVRPSATTAHQLRANHLRRKRVRRRVAAALSRAIEDASRPVQTATSQAPLSREAVRECQQQIRELATLVATLENPRTQGVAIAFQLAFDGRGALFFQPQARDGGERLANTLRAAHCALRVSAEFDEPGG
jgi:hypothetical protein